MKKIAVFTWCYDMGKTNYGQILQCYATQTILKKIGAESKVVRYRKPEINETVIPYHNVELRKQYEREYRVEKQEGKYDGRIEKFFEFIEENIICTPFCYNIDEVNFSIEDMDILLCGSDQLWEPHWYDPITTFEYASGSKRKISFATSGVLNESGDNRKIYTALGKTLEKFDAISVREKVGKNILSSYVRNKEIVEVLDPTMMLGREEWDELSVSNIHGEEYILCFCLGEFTPRKIVLKNLMKVYNLGKVIYIKSNYFDERIVSEGKFDEAQDVGPREFISLVRNAKAVLTDSYHGCVFSIIYNKPFYIVNNVRSERLMDICNKLNIGNRKANSVKELKNVDEIDYKDVNRRIWYWQEVSNTFLKKAIDLGGRDEDFSNNACI